MVGAVTSGHAIRISTRSRQVDISGHLRCAVIADLARVHFVRALIEPAWPCRKGEHHRAVDVLERGAPAALELLERPRVQIFEERGDRFIELGEAEELAVAQPSQDRPLRNLHANFDLGLSRAFPGRAGMIAVS